MKIQCMKMCCLQVLSISLVHTAPDMKGLTNHPSFQEGPHIDLFFKKRAYFLENNFSKVSLNSIVNKKKIPVILQE